MSRTSMPELTRYLDKRVSLQLNGNRSVVGILRGFDQFMNIVMEDTIEQKENKQIQTGTVVIRGNSIIVMEALEKITLA